MDFAKRHKLLIGLLVVGIAYWAYKRLQNSGGVGAYQALLGGWHLGSWYPFGMTAIKPGNGSAINVVKV